MEKLKNEIMNLIETAHDYELLTIILRFVRRLLG